MGLKGRLNLMMFLEYAAKGIWLPLAAIFLGDEGLGFSQSEKGWIIAISSAVGAMCSPFICRLCDQKFATEKCLAILLFLVGILKIVIAEQSSFIAWLLLAMAFSILYVPTMALTNSLAMTHLQDPKNEFSRVRVWGTIGWIAVAWVFPMVWLKTNLSFQWLPPFFTGDNLLDHAARTIHSMTAAGLICIVYAVYCWFALPATPPKGAGKGFNMGEALSMFRHRSFTVLMVTALLISSIHFLYFMQMGSFLKKAGLENHEVLPAMSLGQMSEIVVLAFLGPLIARCGFRWIMVIGAASFALRYFIFSLGLPVSAYVSAQLLHGLCFGCFFAVAFIYVDRVASPTVKHSAQALFVFVMFGLGPLIAGQINNSLAAGAGQLDLAGYAFYWKWAALIPLGAAIIHAAFFRDETKDSKPQPAELKNDE